MIKEISGVNPLKCMKCGKCSASCPSYNEMDIKPHQFVSYVINEDIESLVNSKSLWKCLSCFACVERCPRDVKPGKLIDAARQIVVRERGKTYLDSGRGAGADRSRHTAAAACERVQKIQEVIKGAEDWSICLPLRNEYRRYGRRKESCGDGGAMSRVLSMRRTMHICVPRLDRRRSTKRSKRKN